MASHAPHTPHPRGSSGNTTNAIPSSEFRQMLEEYHVRNPTGDNSPPNSRDLVVLPRRRPIPQPPATPLPDVRIILGASSSQALSIRLDPLGSVDADAESETRLGLGVLDAAAASKGTPLPATMSYQKLSVTQSKKDIGVTIQATAYPGQRTRATGPAPPELVNCILYFDPVADRIVLLNQGHESITAVMLAEEQQQQVPAQSIRSIAIGREKSTLLDAGVWTIRTADGEHILDFSILARRYISVVPAGAVPQGTKRQRISSSSQSQVPGPAKRGKVDEPGPEGKTVIVFQPARLQSSAGPLPRAPAPAPAQPPATAPAPQGLIVSSNTIRDIVPLPLGHPMQNLGAGDMARIIGDDGEYYTLTYDKQIALRSNCHVFSAQHSALPDKMAVVKVIRSPMGPFDPTDTSRAARHIVAMAEVWVREVKNHLRVSQHASVVRLFDSDSRFLALYMEHINAPSLYTYCERVPQNPMCTLAKPAVAKVLVDMSNALMYIHNEGIVHNDIKPDNILYSPARGAVLIDFGLSTEMENESVHAGGTPWYVPPEFLDEEDQPRGAPGDVFALGVMMLFVAGKLPLPEKCVSHPAWHILEALSEKSQAQQAMQHWLRVVRIATNKLDVKDKVERAIETMVQVDFNTRVQADKLVASLRE